MLSILHACMHHAANIEELVCLGFECWTELSSHVTDGPELIYKLLNC